MKKFNRKAHWETIYQTKKFEETGWYQQTPVTSLAFVAKLKLPHTARIIDVGGGDSYFVDHLLDLGFENITVLDISKTAIARAKARLGERAKKVHWIVCDVSQFKPAQQYDFWHDRAAFHFLTEEREIEHYLRTIRDCLAENGFLVIGTFSEQGPKTCSGIPVHQYSEASMTEKLGQFFERIECITLDHLTPFNTTQHYLFCSFKQLNLN
ncbi:MAG: class I SAM-dependent methyltransferase [Saprospiraceae bacterium]